MAGKRAASLLLPFALVLALLSGSLHAAGAVCGSSDLGDVTSLAGMAAIATALLIALVYMAGEFMQSARAITWAKTEAAEIIISLAAVAIILFAVSTFCSVQVGEATSIFSRTPYIYQNNPTASIYDGAQVYLENLMGTGLRNMADLRYNLGAYEMRTSYVKYTCDSLCWLSMTSTTEAVHGGETLPLAITNNLLGTATVSYLTAAFEYFVLQYISKGLFLMFLPIAIVVRSLPFMRPLGGAMIGIILALYLFYPLMLVANAVVAPSLAAGLHPTIVDRDGTQCAGIDVFKDPYGNEQVACQEPNDPNGKNYEWQLSGVGSVFISDSNLPNPSSLVEDVKTNALLFVATIFLAAVNFIVIAALARDLTRFLGEETDISRLGQMV